MATSRSGNTVTGTVTFKDLGKVSAWFSQSHLRSWGSYTAGWGAKVSVKTPDPKTVTE